MASRNPAPPTRLKSSPALSALDASDSESDQRTLVQSPSKEGASFNGEPFDDLEDPSLIPSERRFPLSLWNAIISAVPVRQRYRPLGAHASTRESLSFNSRPSFAQRSSCAKFACGTVVIIILIFIGIFVVSELSILDRKKEPPFLPHWGEPGYLGEGLAHYPTDFTRDVLPIPCHSHNDYWRRIPLFEAIHYGCISVEADVWLFEEELYVGHDTASLTTNRTFRSLYVNPILHILDKQNPSTRFSHSTNLGVFDEDPGQTLILLVDFKTPGEQTLTYVERQLDALRSKNYLTYFDGEKVVEGPVTVVGTGNTPFDKMVSNSTYRDIFFDAPLDIMGFDSETNPTAADDAKRYKPTNSYYASTSLYHAIGSIWRGYLTAKQLAIIRSQIKGAQKLGLKARYWETPGWPIWLRNHVWQVLLREGADMLNVDDLEAAAKRDWKEDNGWFAERATNPP